MQEGKITYKAIDRSLNYLWKCNRISSHIKQRLDSCARDSFKYIVGYNVKCQFDATR